MCSAISTLGCWESLVGSPRLFISAFVRQSIFEKSSPIVPDVVVVGKAVVPRISSETPKAKLTYCSRRWETVGTVCLVMGIAMVYHEEIPSHSQLLTSTVEMQRHELLRWSSVGNQSPFDTHGTQN
ncbi:hypothetical protein E2C01_014391 [Portunus trituberculatus]|uniref:Uncharacterized protein n=1 Tax=Portunus trituberculatus TaxID=210409 RepID=A0A5B7DJR2_PORTR|nr:hypothetical protein [Portunus trituberculatus]